MELLKSVKRKFKSPYTKAPFYQNQAIEHVRAPNEPIVVTTAKGPVKVTEWYYWQYFNIRKLSNNEKTVEFLRQMLAEMFGCWILTFIVLCSNCQKSLYGTAFLEQNIAVGFGLFLGIVVSAPVSGGHINPAVTAEM